MLRAEQGAALLVAQEEKKQLHDQNGQLMVNLQAALQFLELLGWGLLNLILTNAYRMVRERQFFHMSS